VLGVKCCEGGGEGGEDITPSLTPSAEAGGVWECGSGSWVGEEGVGFFFFSFFLFFFFSLEYRVHTYHTYIHA